MVLLIASAIRSQIQQERGVERDYILKQDNIEEDNAMMLTTASISATTRPLPSDTTLFPRTALLLLRRTLLPTSKTTINKFCIRPTPLQQPFNIPQFQFPAATPRKRLFNRAVHRLQCIACLFRDIGPQGLVEKFDFKGCLEHSSHAEVGDFSEGGEEVVCEGFNKGVHYAW